MESEILNEIDWEAYIELEEERSKKTEKRYKKGRKNVKSS